MDKIDKISIYRQHIQELLTKRSQLRSPSDPITSQLIFDPIRDRYQLVNVGWKNENIKAGLGQCMASMVAAQLFNQQENRPINPIYGAVTTGEIWRFLQLSGDRVEIAMRNWYIQDVNHILGILALVDH